MYVKSFVGRYYDERNEKKMYVLKIVCAAIIRFLKTSNSKKMKIPHAWKTKTDTFPAADTKTLSHCNSPPPQLLVGPGGGGGWGRPMGSRQPRGEGRHWLGDEQAPPPPA